MRKQYFSTKLLSALLFTTFLTACNSNANISSNTQTAVTSESKTSTASEKSIKITSDMIVYDKNDYYTDWKSENPSYIELKGSTATINGTGAEVSGSKVTISKAGVYAISGKLNDGQIIVNAQDKGTVKLVLNSAEINSSNSSAIYVQNAEKAIISLVEGTQNSISDGKKYSTSSDDEPNSAIFSKADLTINGTGTLNVSGNFNDGITSKDELRITGGNIAVNSADDAITGKDMVLIKDGKISIQSTGDGIKATNDTDTTKGFIAIQGGTFEVKAGMDGLQAETSILVTDGKFDITTGGGSAKAVAKTNDNMQGPMGKQGQNNQTQTQTTETDSMKGIKAASDITIQGGTFNIDSADDSIHSSNSIDVVKGTFSLTSGDDGIHSDKTLVIEGGSVDIKKSYEGIESSEITISGGENHVVSSDDGINVSGGNDGSAVNGRPGQNNFSAATDGKLNINGGYLYVEANGDGLDSNGSINMTDGTVVVNGPTANNNGALDYNGTFEISGGTLIAAGSSGMAQAPSEDSKQNSISMTFSQNQQAGTMVSVQDSTGKVIASFAPKKQYQSLVISSPDVKKDAKYTLSTGGTSTGTLKDGLYTGGSYGSGTKVVDFTTNNSSTVTWLNESGVTTAKSGNPMGGGGPGQNGGFGQNGGRGGMKQQ